MSLVFDSLYTLINRPIVRWSKCSISPPWKPEYTQSPRGRKPLAKLYEMPFSYTKIAAGRHLYFFQNHSCRRKHFQCTCMSLFYHLKISNVADMTLSFDPDLSTVNSYGTHCAKFNWTCPYAQITDKRSATNEQTNERTNRPTNMHDHNNSLEDATKTKCTTADRQIT